MTVAPSLPSYSILNFSTPIGKSPTGALVTRNFDAFDNDKVPRLTTSLALTSICTFDFIEATVPETVVAPTVNECFTPPSDKKEEDEGRMTK